MPRLTPIERAAAGEPTDRRRRWEHRMANKGFKRMTLYVREPQVPVVEALKLALRDMDARDLQFMQYGLHEYFRQSAEEMERELELHPELAEETTIEEEIAACRAAADATVTELDLDD